MLTKNTRDYIMILTDNREVNITSGQKKAIEEWIRDKVPLIEVYDADDRNELLFSGKAQSIREFRQRKHDQNLASMRWVCGYGTKHYLQEECKCDTKFKCLPWRIKTWCIDKYGITADSQMTQDMQNEFIEYTEKEKPSWIIKKNDTSFN